jgi:hypothetical protein
MSGDSSVTTVCFPLDTRPIFASMTGAGSCQSRPRGKDQGKRCEGSRRFLLASACAFRFKYPQPDCGAPGARGIRRRFRGRDWLHHRRDEGCVAFGSIVASYFYPPPYQPLSNFASALFRDDRSGVKPSNGLCTGRPPPSFLSVTAAGGEFCGPARTEPCGILLR